MADYSEITLEGQGLTLSAEGNERGCADILVEDRHGNSSSYDCAINEGALDSDLGDDGRRLTEKQLKWLLGAEVANYLERAGY